MNWYRKLKQADSPLPSFEYPETHVDDVGAGLNSIDSEMDAEDAWKQEQKHPNLIYEGSGYFGVAFAKDDVVVKYTRHYSEYNSANEILKMQEETGGRIPGFVKVFHTEALKNDVFAIIMERLEPLNEEEKNFVADIGAGGHTEFQDNPDFLDVHKKYEEMISNIHQSGGDPWDSHEHNIGKLPNGEYVMFDLGGLFE